jgi:hypothetical protein
MIAINLKIERGNSNETYISQMLKMTDIILTWIRQIILRSLKYPLFLVFLNYRFHQSMLP